MERLRLVLRFVLSRFRSRVLLEERDSLRRAAYEDVEYQEVFIVVRTSKSSLSSLSMLFCKGKHIISWWLELNPSN